MVLLDGMWDDVLAGPQPERGLGKLRKISTDYLQEKESSGGLGKYFQRSPSSSTPQSPRSPTLPGSPTGGGNENVWRSVFNPGSNPATRSIGADVFDKPQRHNSPTIYDWLYSGETKSSHR